MIANFTEYAEVKVTPSTITMITVQNPLGIVPKYVHITCEHDSAPYTIDGYLREVWLSQKEGMMYGTNGSDGSYHGKFLRPVNQSPTSTETFYLSSTEISIYKGNGAVSGRWRTDTEYTVHIYA